MSNVTIMQKSGLIGEHKGRWITLPCSNYSKYIPDVIMQNSAYRNEDTVTATVAHRFHSLIMEGRHMDVFAFSLWLLIAFAGRLRRVLIRVLIIHVLIR